MYTLHPDKLLALNTRVGKVPPPTPQPAAPAPRRTYDLRRPSLVENLAQRLYTQSQQRGR